MRVEVDLPATVTRAQVEELCDVLRRRLGRGDVRLVVCDAHRLPGEICAVEALARVALTARRGGAAVRVRGAGPGLQSLLVLLGLDQIMAEEPVATTPVNACPSAPPVRTVSGAPHVLPPRGSP